MTYYDVIIIGGGLGGLECANILARNGINVLLLEQGKQLGGCIQSYNRHGLGFDTGFHYVGGLDEGQSLYAPFCYLGLLDLPWKRLDSYFDRVTIGGYTFMYSQGYEAYANTLSEYFPSERDALYKYVELLKETSRQQRSLFNPDAVTYEYSQYLFETSAWQYLRETFHDQLLIDVLSATSLKMELRKESLPLFTFVHGNGSYIESSWRLQGDASLLVDALAKGITTHGGNIICNTKVQQLVEKNGKIISVICSNGEVYEGKNFISDIHPSLTCDLIKQSDKMKYVYRKRIGGLENTFGMFTVSLCIKPNTLKYFNWNQYIYTQPDVWTFYQKKGSITGLLVSARVPEDGGSYTRQIDLLTPMLWEECQSWHDTKTGHRGTDYKDLKERLAGECISLVEENFIPGLRDMITGYYTSTPLTYRDYTGTPSGSAYGLRKDYKNPLMTILSVRTPIPNLFLTGQNLMLHGLQGVTMTSLFTCAELLGKEKIRNIIANKI